MRKGRPPLPLGSHGEISYEHVGPSRYLARARYRTRDGRTVRVARAGQTKGDARNRLLAALAEDQQAGGELSGRSKVSELVERWQAEIAESKRRPQTVDQYRTQSRHVLDRIGDIRVGELTPGRCDALLRAVKNEHGPGAARQVRTVLNGIGKLAVRDGALAVNPVRETSAIESPQRRPRALTADEAEDLTDRLRSDELAGALDLPDLIDMGLATGCRVGELVAIRHAFNEDGDPVLDLDRGTVEINATVVRHRGKGLVLQPRPKTAAGWRVLALPGDAIEMLRGRQERLEFRAPDGVVFGHPFRSALRDTCKVAAALREVLPRLGFGWVTMHTLRRTVATRLDEAGLSAREIADQLGHAKPSMTQDVYMGRNVVSARAAQALDRSRGTT